MDERVEAFREEVQHWRGTRRKGARPYTAVMNVDFAYPEANASLCGCVRNRRGDRAASAPKEEGARRALLGGEGKLASPRFARSAKPRMKAKALQLAKDLQGHGLAMHVVAKRLGICAATLYLWRGSSKGSRMVPVTVVRAEPQVAAPTCFTLVSPRGYRLEGLPVELAMAMLQELG